MKPTKHNVGLLFCIPENIQKPWDDLKEPVISDSSAIADDIDGKFESYKILAIFLQDASKSVKYSLKLQRMKETTYSIIATLYQLFAIVPEI